MDVLRAAKDRVPRLEQRVAEGTSALQLAHADLLRRRTQGLADDEAERVRAEFRKRLSARAREEQGEAAAAHRGVGHEADKLRTMQGRAPDDDLVLRSSLQRSLERASSS